MKLSISAYSLVVGLSDPLLRLGHGGDNLHRVDTALRGSVETADEFLTQVASHLILAGGKRMRPLLCAAAASIPTPGEAAPQDSIMGGVSVELVQVGSLYHDDVMDEADTRRSVESVNARWGNLTAILAGDFLLAKASEIAASLGVEVAGLLAATIGQLCEGQVLEIQDVFNPQRTMDRYLRSIDGKTAALFATACRIGGIVTEQSRPEIDALTAYGRSFGLAFQVVDDVLDTIASDEQLGKPAGHDLIEGVYTLPVLHTIAGEHGAELASLLGGPLETAPFEQAIQLVRSGDGVAQALRTAESYADEACAALAGFPANPITDALRETAQEVVSQARQISTAA